MNDRFDHDPEDDEIVGFLRSTDPGEPPVTLGPGSSLRHRAAVRHARRQAVGAVIAVGLIGVAVAGSVVGTRHHTTVTPAVGNPIQRPSIDTTADESAVPSQTVPVVVPTERPVTISATTAPSASESATAHTQASPSIPHVVDASLRSVGTVSVGQLVTLTVRASWAGTSYVPGINRVDYGDGLTNETRASCLPSSSYASDDRTASSFGELTPDTHTYTAPGTYTVRMWVGYLCGPHAADFALTGTVVVVGGSTSPSASTSPSPSVAPTSPNPSATPTAQPSDSASPTP